MSYYEERFKNHPVHESLEECLEDLQNHELEAVTPEELDAITRTSHVVEFAKTTLNRCDADLVCPAALKQLNAAVESILATWTVFCENRAWEELTTPCDALLAVVGALSAKHRPIPKSYVNLLSSLRSNVAKILRELREPKQELEEEYGSFQAELDALNNKLEQYDTRAQKQDDRLNTLVAEQQDKFTLAQEMRTDKFTAAQEMRTEQFNEVAVTADQAFEEAQVARDTQASTQYKELSKAGQEHVKTLQAHCDHAKEIVGIIGNVGATGNYQKIANKQKYEADLFRWIAVGCFGAMIVVAIIVICMSFGTGQTGWDMMLFRVLTAAIFAAPGVYCALESRKHRKIEQENRRLELEMASVSPFLEKLNNPEKASEILAELAPEYFGKHASEHCSAPLINIDGKAVDLKKVLLEALKQYAGQS